VRTIAVVTGTRAEYGLLRWLMKEIRATGGLTLRLLVTGAHFSPRFGETWREIEADGFAIGEKIDMQLDGDTPGDIARSMGLALAGFTESFTRRRPDIVVIVGDRYEMLAAAEAAMLARIPIEHIHGGELTEGAIDDAIRHAITKMAHLHFVSCAAYRQRVVQMGEQPERVFDVGALGIDGLMQADIPSLAELERTVGLKLDGGYLLLTFHPVTLDAHAGVVGLRAMLEALDGFSRVPVIVTGVNSDPGHSSIAQILTDYATARNDRVRVIPSLGQLLYFSAMRHSLAVVGNSSSGLIEAPSLGVPTVNIGDRQKGRIRATSVIDCGETFDEVTAALQKALSPSFRARLRQVRSPYGSGGAARRIAAVLKEHPLVGILHKSFHDTVMAVPEIGQSVGVGCGRT
jgi:UDP-hydrolysing UDP-N-acetyl-D-glucosamine 2-epimerase